MDKPGLFQIGTVAKLFHLSVSSLRHYEDIGLLKPEYVSPESGYRYYSARQFEVLSSIRYLRALDLPLPEIADFLKNKDVDRIEEKLRQQKQAVIERQQALQRVERRIDNRLRQLESAQHARLDEITLTRAPACRLCWIQSSLKIRSSLDMEPPIRRLEETQKDAVVFLGKVGLGITPENLYAGAYDQYDGIFLVLDEEDEFTGPVTDLPETDCLCVRFRGSHPEAPAQYRCLMARATARADRDGLFARDHPHRLRHHGRHGEICHGDQSPRRAAGLKNACAGRADRVQ